MVFNKKAYNAAWNERNRERIRANAKKYRQKNKEKIKISQNKWRKKVLADRPPRRIRSVIEVHLAQRLRNQINRSIKSKKGRKGFSLKNLGCSTLELKVHLESQFQKGMTWENHAFYGWHVDHIIPLGFYDLTDREQFLKAVHYTNLQPLWAQDNWKKPKTKRGITLLIEKNLGKVI